MAECLSCGQDNPPGALFCVGCGSALGVACAACGRVAPSGSRFCPGCGSPLVPEPSAAEMRKTVTVVFVDVAGSTPMGEILDPESLRRLMVRFLEEAERVFKLHGGTVVQFSGDAILAVFGIPTAHEDDALRAVHAALAMRTALTDLNEELIATWGSEIAIRTGINTGEVLAGDTVVGREIVVGDAVNLAARLQQAAPVNEILIGETTQELIGHEVVGEQLASLTLKGKTEPVAAWRVAGAGPRSTEPRAHLDLVGRQRELELLQNAIDRAADERTCHLVTVLGQPGVGKSRLIAEVVALNSSKVSTYTGRCLPYGEGITFWPMVEIVQRAAGFVEGDSLPLARKKLIELIGSDDAAAVGEVIAQTIGLREQIVGREQIFWAFRKLIRSLATDHAVVLVLDDIHWGEDMLLDLIEYLVDTIRDRAVTLVCLARDELLERRAMWGGGKPNSSTFSLSPLGDEEAGVLVEGMLEGKIADDLHTRLMDLASGNPLYLEEMIRRLNEDGALVRNGHWALRPDASVEAPASLNALVASRLDRLSRSERSVVGVAAVIGKIWPRAAVEELSGQAGDIENALRSLQRRDLIRLESGEGPGTETYSFKHLLIRDAAYEAIPKEQRSGLHREFADWMTRTLGGLEGGYEEIIAYHHEQACIYHRDVFGSLPSSLVGAAFDRLLAAGTRAAERSDFIAAARLLERGADLLPETDPQRARMLPRLGYALAFVPNYEAADAVLNEALRFARSSKDEVLEMSARLELERLRISTRPKGSADRVRELAVLATRVFEQHDDQAGLARAWHLRGWADANEGKLADADDAFARGVTHAQLSRELVWEERCRGASINVMTFGSVSAEEIATRASGHLEWARNAGSLLLEGHARVAIAFANAIARRPKGVANELGRYENILEEIADPYLSARGGLLIALTHRFLGDAQKAIETLRRSVRLSESIDERYTLATYLALLSDLLVHHGDLKEADAISRRALKIADEKDLMPQIDGRRARAKVLLATDPVAAEDAICEAIDLAEASEFLIARADAHIDQAQILASSQRREEAVAALVRGCELHSMKGNVAAAAEAEARIRPLLD